MRQQGRWNRGVVLGGSLFVLLCSAVVVQADSFGQAAERWLDAFCPAGQECRVGDVNGDGKADVLAFVRSSADGTKTGNVDVALSNGSSFAPTNAAWQNFFCVGDEVCDVGDFNGDGKDDVIAFVRDPAAGMPAGQQGDVYVALSNGSQFGPSGNQWQEFFCIDSETCDVGDFNGDGKDDIVAFVQSTNTNGQEGDVYVALSTGSSFGVGTRWQISFCLNNDVCEVGDFNGDGKADIAAFTRDTRAGANQSNVYVALSNGTSFSEPTLWQTALCPNSREVCATGDANGDGRDDAVVFVRDGELGMAQNNVLVARSTTSNFLPPRVYLPYIQR